MVGGGAEKHNLLIILPLFEMANGQIVVGNNKRAMAAAAGAAVARAMQVAPRVAQAIQRGRDAGARRAAQRSNENRATRKNEVSAPVSQGLSSMPGPTYKISMKGNNGHCRTITGSSCLGVVTTGTVTGSLPQASFFSSSNPVVFPDRMKLEAQLFDKYVYKRVTLRYVPQVSTSTSGMVAVAIDRDYMDDLQTQSWAIATSYESVAFGSVWAPHRTSMARDANEMRTYFTNFGASIEMRECEQFKFYVYTLGCPVSTTLGQVFLDYELELISPVYAPAELTSSGTNVEMQYALGQLQFFAAGSNATAPFLPQNNVAPGNIFEVVFQGAPQNTADFTVGGAVYTPTTAGSCRYFFRGITAAGTARTYKVFLDYPSALANTADQSGLVNTAASVNTVLVAQTQIQFRPISLTSKFDSQ